MSWAGLSLMFGGALAFLFPKQAKQAVSVAAETVKPVFGPFQVFGPTPQSVIDNAAFEKARAELIAHEGRRNDAYYDTEGVLTIGIGHKVLPEDNIRVGQKISDSQVEAFFQADMEKAFAAARGQAQELGKYTADMIAALVSVNFQLGTNWRTKFSNTWNDLKLGNVASAINRLKTSKWAQQTPARVASFVDSLERIFS